MLPEHWKQNQPAAAKVLSHALKGGSLAHAYLFWGPAGAPKEETARLLVQSLLCRNPDPDGFACGACTACKAFQHQSSLGFVQLDTMKKQDVLQLKEFFSQTGDGWRCCLLTNFEEASPAVANALLKFMEEPGEDTLILLTAKDKGAVLPTIESRCQCIQLRPASLEMRLEQVKQLENPLAACLAQLGYPREEIQRICAQPESARILQEARQVLKDPGSPESLFGLQTRLFPAKGDLTTRENIRIFFEVLLLLVRTEGGPAVMRQVLVEQIGRVRKVSDPLLCLDQYMASIRKGMHEQSS